MIEFIKNNATLMTLIVAIFFGGFAGSAFTQIIIWWRAPVLKMVFDEGDRGCATDITPANLIDQNGNIIATGSQRYLRVRINNKGRSTAHNVSVCVTEITFHPVVGNADIFDWEVLDLKTALSGLVTFDLPRGAHRYLDLFCTEDFGNGVQFRFAFTTRPNLLYSRPYGPGSYSVRAFASSNNSASTPGRLSWHWDGTLDGLHIPRG